MMYAPAFDSVIKESNSLIKDALRERLKSNLLHKLPSCCYEDNEKQRDEKIEQCINVDTESKSDSNEEDANSIPLAERRLRNRLAARKCREKRKQRIDHLEKICFELESRMNELKKEIDGLGKQKQSLTKILNNHHCLQKLTHEVLT